MLERTLPSSSLVLAISAAPRHHLENPFGFSVLGCSLSEGRLLLLVWVVSAVCDCAPSLRFVLSIAVPSRPSRLFWINRSTDLLSLSLSPLADDEAYAYHHGDASSASPSASLRPKTKINLTRALQNLKPPPPLCTTSTYRRRPGSRRLKMCICYKTHLHGWCAIH